MKGNVKDLGPSAAVTVECQLAKNKANINHFTGWVGAFQSHEFSLILTWLFLS